MKKAFCLVALFVFITISFSFASFQDMAKFIPANVNWVLRFQNNSENYNTLKGLPTGDLFLNGLGVEMLVEQQINQIKFQQEVNTDALVKLIETNGLIFGTITLTASDIEGKKPERVIKEEMRKVINGLGIILPASSSLDDVKVAIEKVFFAGGQIESRIYNKKTYYAFRSNEKDTLFLYPTAKFYLLVSNEGLLKKCIDSYTDLKPNILSTPYAAYIVQDSNDWIDGFARVSDKKSPADLLIFRGYFAKGSYIFDMSSRLKRKYLLSEEEVKRCFASPLKIIKGLSTEFQGAVAVNIKDLPYLLSKWKEWNFNMPGDISIQDIKDAMNGGGAIVLTFNASPTSTANENTSGLATPTAYFMATIKGAKGKQIILDLISKHPTKQVSKYGGTIYTINPDNPASSTVVFLDNKRVIVRLSGVDEEYLSDLIATPQKTYGETEFFSILKSVLEPNPTFMVGMLNTKDIFQKALQMGENNLIVFQVFWGNEGLLHFRAILR